jgi:hypothetical protein
MKKNYILEDHMDESTAAAFSLLSKIETQVLVYVIKTITRACQLQVKSSDEC